MKKNNWIPYLPFIISIAYWIYLLFTTSMVIVFDAAGYERLGHLIHTEGIIAFFKLHPEKVGLYPYIISLSMDIGQILSVSYQKIQAIIQIGFLFAAQILIYKILIRLNINKMIIAATVLYFGISPAMVNSALSLYSEIITYPLALGALLIATKIWDFIPQKKTKQAILYSISLSVIFAFLSLARAVNEYIFYLYILTFLILSIRYIWTKQIKLFLNITGVLVISCLSFYLVLMPYKMMNYKHNGYKVLTSVGSESLYSTAIGRVRNLNRTNLLTFLANVAGERVCRKNFGKEECAFWSDEHDYIFGKQKTLELAAQNLNHDEINDILMDLAVKEIMKKPFQYTFLTAAEGLKLVFWESTLIGYVNYPKWLQNIFLLTPFKNGLRLLIFLLTFCAIVFGLFYTLRNLGKIYNFTDPKNIMITHLIFILIMILGNIALYAPFKAVPRYGFQIVPLYMILIACMINTICIKRR